MSQRQISNVIFISCITLVSFSFISLIFPGLLVESSNNIIQKDVNLFELGTWSIVLLSTNIIFIISFILYKKNKIPNKISKIFQYIEKNDISKKTSLIILILLFFVYVSFTIDEFGREELEFGDYQGASEYAKNFEFKDTISIEPQIRYFLLHISYVAFDNIRILPFVASISLLLITYLLTLELTKKRVSAVIAFTVLMQSNLFLIFDTTATYENFWTGFYFLSLYLILRKPVLSPISFILGMMSKPLVITYLPISLFAISNKKISKRNKIILLVSYGIIISLVLIAFSTNNLIHTHSLDFDISRLIASFNEMGNSLRFDSLILILIIPTLIILQKKSGEIRNNINIVLVGLSFVILSQPIMYSLIGMTLQPYRFIPFIVFSAIAIGMIFSNSKMKDQE